jgi:hypothetical protein
MVDVRASSGKFVKLAPAAVQDKLNKFDFVVSVLDRAGKDNVDHAVSLRPRLIDDRSAFVLRDVVCDPANAADIFKWDGGEVQKDLFGEAGIPLFML